MSGNQYGYYPGGQMYMPTQPQIYQPHLTNIPSNYSTGTYNQIPSTGWPPIHTSPSTPYNQYQHQNNYQNNTNYQQNWNQQSTHTYNQPKTGYQNTYTPEQTNYSHTMTGSNAPVHNYSPYNTNELPQTNVVQTNSHDMRNDTPKPPENQKVNTFQTEFFLQQLELDRAQKQSKSRRDELDKKQKEIEQRQKEIEEQKKMLEEHQRMIQKNIERDRMKSRIRASHKESELSEKKHTIEIKKNLLNESNGRAPSPVQEDKLKETLYSCLIDNVKNTASNSHRVSDLVLHSFEKLLNPNSDEFSLFSDIIEYLDSIINRLDEIVKENFLNVDNNLHNSISLSTRNLTCSARSLVTLGRRLMDQSNGFAGRENLKNNIKQSCIAVTFSIKKFIEELEGLKISEGLNPLNIPILSAKSIEEAENNVDKVVISQSQVDPELFAKPASPRKTKSLNLKPVDTSRFNTIDYPVDKIKAVQAIVKRWVVGHRFRTIVYEWKESKDSGVLRTRQKALFEILETEERYIKALDIFKTCFIAEYKRAAPSIPISNNQLSVLFGNIELILEFSRTLCHQLSERLSQWPSVQLVGDIFVENAEKMMIYADYINNVDESMSLYAQLKNNPNFIELEKKCVEKAGMRMDASSFFIMPVQRLPRYQLLLRELLKYTSQDHIDCINLSEAKDKITAINIEINRRKREHDNKLIVSRIKQDITGIYGLELLAENRLFVKSCFMSVESESEKYYAHGYLFNDILVLTRSSKKEQPPFKYIEHLNLLDIGIVMNKSWWKTSIKLWDKSGIRKKDWLLHYHESEMCDEWYKDLSEAIETHSLKTMLNDKMSPSGAEEEPTLSILSASYGDLKKPKFCIDVSTQLQNLVDSSGGKSLRLEAGTKSTLPGFTDPLKGKKKYMLIVFSFAGAIKTRTYEDEDEIKLP